MTPGRRQVLGEPVASSRAVVTRSRGGAHSGCSETFSPLVSGFPEGATSGEGQSIGAPHQPTAVLCATDLKVLLGCTPEG